MPDGKRYSLIRPTIDTPLHIDFEWWKTHDNNWRVFLQSYLCPTHQAAFASMDQDSQIDFIDPQTAEVHSMDGLQHVLMSHCARQPEFINVNTTLVDGAFRVFLANGNAPLSSKELAERINRPPETILRTLLGPTIYKGLRPFLQGN